MQRGHNRVVRHGQRQAQAVALAVLGQIADAGLDRVRRGLYVHFPAVYEDLAAQALVRAGHKARRFRAPRAHQAGKAEDLALAQDEGHVLDVLGEQMPGLQNDGGVRRHIALFLGLLVDDAADHHADDLVHRHLGGVHRADVLAVAHDGDAVGDLFEFAHAVGYVDDAHAARLQITDEAEQLLDLAFSQRRGRLVHDEYARVVVGEGLGDLHHLLAGHGQRADDGGGADVDGKAG